MSRYHKYLRPTKGDHRDTLGVWADLAFDRVFGSAGANYSAYDLLLRKQFQEAWEGKPQAIRTMVRMIKSNLAYQVVEESPYWESPRYGKRPRNADVALLILDICAIDNGRLERVGQREDEHYLGNVAVLRPTRFTRWVVDLALSQGNTADRLRAERDEIERVTVSPDDAGASEWYANRERFVTDLVRMRGPGTTRFKPGRSGNYQGRPRKREYHFPYADFLMEAVTVPLHGEQKTMTRLDALMTKLTRMSVQDEKIARLLLPVLMQIHEERFEQKMRIPVVVRV